MKAAIRNALRKAIRELVRDVAREEVGERLMFCRPGHHFFQGNALNARGCSVCVYTVAACDRHGGGDHASVSVTHHLGWLAGSRGRDLYGSVHAAARDHEAGIRRRKRA